MNIFITGASGYIGGTLALRLEAAGHTVRGLCRNEAKAEQLRRLGIEPLMGILDDGVLSAAAARAADAVINAASSDHRPCVEALIAGLKGSQKDFDPHQRIKRYRRQRKGQYSFGQDF